MSLTKSKKFMIVFGIIIAILLIYFCFREFKTIRVAMDAFNRMDFLDQLRDQTPMDAVLLMILLAGFSIIPGIPVSVVAILTGVVFGQVLGSIINVTGIVLGNLTAQKIFTYFHEKVDTKKTPKIVTFIRRMKHPMWGIVIGYSIPFIPTSIISLTATDMNLDRKQLLTATIIGSAPMAIIYSCGGDSLIEGHYQLLIVLLVIVAVMLIIFYFVNRSIKDDDV